MQTNRTDILLIRFCFSDKPSGKALPLTGDIPKEHEATEESSESDEDMEAQDADTQDEDEGGNEMENINEMELEMLDFMASPPED